MITSPAFLPKANRRLSGENLAAVQLTGPASVSTSMPFSMSHTVSAFPGRCSGLRRKGIGEMATHMAEPAAGGADAAVEHVKTEDRIALLRAMLLMRGLEERAMSLYRQGKVPGSFYDGYGQEAVSAGAAFAMAPEDRLCILHRDLAAHVIRGVAPARILAQYLGREAGVTRAATATCISVTGAWAVSGWSRCCPT